jgi:hypothetical protein
VPAGDQVYTIDDFSRGLLTKPTEIGLTKGAATVAENIRLNSEHGALTKRDPVLLYGTADNTEPITGMHRLYLKTGTKYIVVSHGDEIEYGADSTGTFTKILDLAYPDYRWQFLTWHNICIGTDGMNQPMKWDGASSSATYLGSCLGTDAGSGAGPSGTYTYKVSFYTATYEVIFNVASSAVTVVDNDINLTMIPIGPDTYLGEDVVGRKVYRIANGGTEYKLLSNGTIANNTAVTLTDSDADGALGASYPTVNNTTVFDATVPKGKYCLIHKNRLWIANNSVNPSRLYYSDDGSHDFFETDSYFDIRPNDGDQITFIKNVLGILTVSKDNTIQKLYTDGDDPDEDWAISDPFSFVGCRAPYTAVNTPVGIMYLSYAGLYIFNGQFSVKISDSIDPTIKDILESNFSNCWGEYNKNIYYLAYPSKATGISQNNRILIYDMINKSYTTDLLYINAMCNFASGTDWDILYSGSASDGTVYAHASGTYEVVHRRHSDFTGTWDDCRYIPTTSGGDSESPVIEIAWTETLGDITPATVGITTTSTVGRPDKDGTYTSQVLDLGASGFDKLYWNEELTPYGDIEFFMRSGSTATGCQVASWNTTYALGDPLGSDCSSITADRYVQYCASLETSDITYSPSLYKNNNYVIKLSYFKEAANTESSIPFRWESGWVDLMPGYTKGLKKLDLYYESESAGTLTVEFSNYEGGTNTFTVNLAAYPEHYTEYFTGGKFLGELFKIKVSENSLRDLTIKRMSVLYDIEPIY